MPALFYNAAERQLYNEHGRRIEGSIFDKFKIEDLAPRSRRRGVANWWLLPGKKHAHSAFAWHDEEDGKERVLFLPGELKLTEMHMLSRELFRDKVPSAIIFRINNHKRPYVYHR